jgi:hypothetical protein
MGRTTLTSIDGTTMIRRLVSLISRHRSISLLKTNIMTVFLYLHGNRTTRQQIYFLTDQLLEYPSWSSSRRSILLCHAVSDTAFVPVEVWSLLATLPTFFIRTRTFMDRLPQDWQLYPYSVILSSLDFTV